ncbi:MAG: DUF1328 domain-containing protein [Halobacteriovoraceae bacterium]|nr:DUF1328 domain-containing protein [Halobacteriovoraceae bacterium]
MLYWAVIFFIVALIAGVFGFGGVAAASAGIAQILFYIFLVGFVVSIVLHFARSIDNKSGV